MSFSPVVVLYEYIITVGAEVELFWRKKMTGAVALFLVNRYLTLGYFIYATIYETAGLARPTANGAVGHVCSDSERRLIFCLTDVSRMFIRTASY